MSASSQLVVGEVAGDMAVLTDASSLIVCRLPLALLPPGVEAGHVIDLHASRSTAAEQARDGEIRNLQAELRSRLGPVPVGLHGGDYNPTALSS